ncbi:uncharacterized protein LOC126839128 isoform X1 [Adelges cooleyi]|uniref:uncharacterized protein LOC126839128 isoform X1 n=1 Tax=Adelges cooleyi TaxID=133065 RepID=UPI00217F6B60|nr:uncharacterized protein LOC126839128 isoform X1 [Adelges cooleyi]
MKLFFLLICFFFVDVLADEDLDNYMSYFYLSTTSIKRAYSMNNVTIGDRSGLNGLELVIEAMVDDTNNALEYAEFCKINFLIAIPEQTEILPRIAELSFLPPLLKANYFLRMMIQLMDRLLGIRMDGYKKDLNMETLKSYADYRRTFVVPALKNRIQSRLLDGSVEHVDDEASLLANCRLLGLYLSTQSPESFIVGVKIDLTDFTCTFTDKNDAERRYRKIDNVWSEISMENQVIKSLEQQLRFGYPQGRPIS